MRNLARNDYGVSVRRSSRGIVLIVFLAIILIAFTSIAISRLSASANEQKVRAKTTQALIQSRDAIMAFALNDATAPGTLPCPDGDGDGRSDTVVFGVCPNIRGLVPFRTLNMLQQPLDGSDSPIWYVVSQEYSGTISIPHNSSKASLLMLNNTQPMAFILLAPNYALALPPAMTLQVRAGNVPPPLATLFAEYLEGENANVATDNRYTDIRDDSKFDAAPDTQNDQVLAIPVATFWTEVEGRVLTEVRSSLRACRNLSALHIYPWAAPWIIPPTNMGELNRFEGHLPLVDWATWCGAAPAPAAWVRDHWSSMIYYAICKDGVLNNPPIAPCLELDGVVDNNDAEVIIMAPGIPINPLPRIVLGDYFELENITTDDNTFTLIKPTSRPPNFNDLIYVLP